MIIKSTSFATLFLIEVEFPQYLIIAEQWVECNFSIDIRLEKTTDFALKLTFILLNLIFDIGYNIKKQRKLNTNFNGKQ